MSGTDGSSLSGFFTGVFASGVVAAIVTQLFVRSTGVLNNRDLPDAA
jgi:hypothetical protein